MEIEIIFSPEKQNKESFFLIIVTTIIRYCEKGKTNKESFFIF